MIQIIDEIYTQLSTERMGMSEKTFSKSWLCMSESYLSHIRSMKKPTVSAECLLRLYGRLKKEKSVYAYQIQRAKSPIQKHHLQEGLDLFTDLTSKAQQAIEEYSVTTSET